MNDLLSIPRLRLMQLHALAESSLDLTAAFAELTEQRTKVQEAYQLFKAGLKKNQASAKEKAQLDHERDALFYGMKYELKGELAYPLHNEVSQNVFKALLSAVHKYGSNLPKLPQNEESMALSSFLDVVKDIPALENTHIYRWIPLLEEANNAFREASGEYLHNKSTAIDVSSASESAPELKKALEQLYVKMFAHLHVSDNPEMSRSYSQIKILIDQLN